MSYRAQQAVTDAIRETAYYRRDIVCLLLMVRRAENKSLKLRVAIYKLIYEMQVSDSSIRRYIKKWKDCGVLEVLVRGGNRKATLYQFHLSNLSTWVNQHSSAIERRYELERNADDEITGQIRRNHRSHRDDRQSDDRSYRSNGMEDGKTRSGSGGLKSLAEILDAAGVTQ